MSGSDPLPSRPAKLTVQEIDKAFASAVQALYKNPSFALIGERMSALLEVPVVVSPHTGGFARGLKLQTISGALVLQTFIREWNSDLGFEEQ